MKVQKLLNYTQIRGLSYELVLVSELLGGTSGAEGGVTVTSVGVGPAGVNSYAKNAYVA